MLPGAMIASIASMLPGAMLNPKLLNKSFPFLSTSPHPAFQPSPWVLVVEPVAHGPRVCPGSARGSQAVHRCRVWSPCPPQVRPRPLMMSGGGRLPDTGSSAPWNFGGTRLQAVGDGGLRGLPAWPSRDPRTPPPDSPAAMTGEGPGPSASRVSTEGLRPQARAGVGSVRCPALSLEAEAPHVPSKHRL